MPKFNELQNELEKAYNRVKKPLKERGNFLILADKSVDGIASAAIMYRVISGRGARAAVKFHEAYAPVSQSVKAYSADATIALDMGGDTVNELGSQGLLISIDKEPSSGINGEAFGFDGSSDVSCATLSYMFAKIALEEGFGLATLAVIGSLGDWQDVGDKRNLISLNEAALNEANLKEVIGIEERLEFPLGQLLPLHRSLTLSVDPYITGLTGNPRAALSYISQAGVELKKEDRFKTAYDLSPEELAKIESSLQELIQDKSEPLKRLSFFSMSEDRISPIWNLRDHSLLAQILIASGRCEEAFMLMLGAHRDLFSSSLDSLIKELENLISRFNRMLADQLRRIVTHSIINIYGDNLFTAMEAPLILRWAALLPDFRGKTIIVQTSLDSNSIFSINNIKKDMYSDVRKLAKDFHGSVKGNGRYMTASTPIFKGSSFLEKLRELLQESEAGVP
ncbi:MAG: DHH family phosphoesterase [Nitrososphaerota archaeon]|nr:DHH family phosphoesterase [Nitrososphaerota archaeon]MDG7049298.1 DHH family phosphoesterase [Nitrososphaerota archaeon]MDG7052030.1 DHH family phosphoesterase [Nitrososphaerota archaeon]